MIPWDEIRRAEQNAVILEALCVNRAARCNEFNLEGPWTSVGGMNAVCKGAHQIAVEVANALPSACMPRMTCTGPPRDYVLRCEWR